MPDILTNISIEENFRDGYTVETAVIISMATSQAAAEHCGAPGPPPFAPARCLQQRSYVSIALSADLPARNRTLTVSSSSDFEQIVSKWLRDCINYVARGLPNRDDNDNGEDRAAVGWYDFILRDRPSEAINREEIEGSRTSQTAAQIGDARTRHQSVDGRFCRHRFCDGFVYPPYPCSFEVARVN